MEAAKSADAFKLGLKADSSVKGKEAMIGPDKDIKINSAESEILCSPEEHYSDLTQGDALEKRSQINAGALNSSEKKDKKQFQQIYGLTHQDDGQADDPMNNPSGY